MEKDFDGWSGRKKNIHGAAQRPFYHRREIWWCAMGINVGSEQDGTGENFDRPVVIIRGFNRAVFFGVALTGRLKRGRYYFPVGKVEDREASAVLSQVRLFDSKRLVRKIGMLDEDVFTKLVEELQGVLFP